MRIFVTGATGLIGRNLVPELQVYGHEIIGLARTDASRSMLSAMRARSYNGQGYDVDRLAQELRDVDAIVHLATGMPSSEAAVEDDWAHSSKIVAGMLRHLIEASETSGVRRIIFPSFCGVYADQGAEWITEDSTIEPDQDAKSYKESEDLLLESTRRGTSIGIILRFGLLYGPEASHTRGLLYGLRTGQAPSGAAGDAYWSNLHVEDAVQSIRLALDHAPEPQIFNICDDEPVQKEELFLKLAQWVGGPRPMDRGRTGPLMPYMGKINASSLQRSIRMRNHKAREVLGFKPKYPTSEAGYKPVIEDWLARRG